MKVKRRSLMVLCLALVAACFAFPARGGERKGFLPRLWESIKPPAEKAEPASSVKTLDSGASTVKRAAVVEEEKKAGGEREDPAGEIPFSKEEMLIAVKRRLKAFPQILFMVPGLSMEENAQGEARYYYGVTGSSEGVPVRLAELDKETLHKIFVRVSNEATRLATERMTRQLQQQERLMRVMRQQQINRQQPVRPPAPHQPPSPPEGASRR